MQALIWYVPWLPGGRGPCLFGQMYGSGVFTYLEDGFFPGPRPPAGYPEAARRPLVVLGHVRLNGHLELLHVVHALGLASLIAGDARAGRPADQNRSLTSAGRERTLLDTGSVPGLGVSALNGRDGPEDRQA
jgi:hypothetical protein